MEVATGVVLCIDLLEASGWRLLLSVTLRGRASVCIESRVWPRFCVFRARSIACCIGALEEFTWLVNRLVAAAHVGFNATMSSVVRNTTALIYELTYHFCI